MRLAMERGPYARAGAARGCWFYLRYFFLFASLIQLLVIMGLVLFMVYGNVHLSTESNLRATERRTDELYGQVQQLSAAQSNLTKQLNLTATAKDAIMQLLLGARRDLERINASFRQCQADRVRRGVRTRVPREGPVSAPRIPSSAPCAPGSAGKAQARHCTPDRHC
jgi:plasmalemma vesicle-associated protein